MATDIVVSNPQAAPINSVPIRGVTKHPSYIGQGEVVFGEGRVPSLDALYTLVRETKPDKKSPLTDAEVMKFEMSRKSSYQWSGLTYGTMGTLGLMDRWRQELEEERRRQRDDERRRRNAAIFVNAGHSRRELAMVSDNPKSLALAIGSQDKHTMNHILAEGGRPYHSHKKLRKRNKGPHQPKPQSEPTNHKKGKKGQDKQKGGKKGRK